MDGLYWSRIVAELGAMLPMNREHGRSRPADSSRNEPEVSKTDAGSILKHIEEALREDGDRS